MLNVIKTNNKKIIKLFTIFIMIISMISPAVKNTKAYDYNIPQPFTKIKEIDYPEWWSRKVGVKQWSTYMCKYNGNYAYCLEASKNTPASGTYPATVIANNESVRKLLYYGYGGPGYNDEIRNIYKQQLLACVPDDFGDKFGNFDDGAYLFTHIWLSYAYSGDLMGLSLGDFNARWPNPDGNSGYGDNIMWGMRVLTSMPDINYAKFVPGKEDGKVALFTAEFDTIDKVQKTNSIKFDGNSNATINIPLQENVTIHISNGTEQTGGTIAISGGQSFYFTAPIGMKINDYIYNNVAGNNCSIFNALAISSGASGTQTEGSWHLNSDSHILKINMNWLDVGHIELTKTNDNHDLIDNSVFTIISQSYQGYSNEVIVKNGKIKISNLPIGSYLIKEKTAPDGYLLNTNTFTVNVETDKTTTQTVIDSEPLGKINLIKSINTDDTHDLLGDAYIENNEYQLIAKDDIKNKAGTITYFKKGDIVDTQKTSTDGKLTFDNLHIGNYQIKESQSNPSLVIDNNIYDIAIEYEGQTIQKIIKVKNTENNIAKQKFEVFKSSEDKGVSGVVKGLKGSEFTFKLKSEVDKVGWNNATIYDVVITGEDGLARTKYLPYGKYIVKETKTPEGYITAPDFIVAIEKDHSKYDEVHEVKKITVNNAPYKSRVKIIKKDLNSNKNITLSSAVFRIKDSQTNEYISQKIGNVKYSYFTTNSDNVIMIYQSQWSSQYDDLGTVITPLELKSGAYEIEEILTPKGFLKLEKPVTFKINNIYDYTDEDNEAVIEVIVKNKQPKGEFNIEKTIKSNNNVDLSLINTSDLSKIKFNLYAKKDVISAIDGSIIYKKDAIVGRYNLSKDGKLHVDNLPMGEYYIKETNTSAGLVLDNKTYDIVFEQKNLKTKVYTVDLKIENKPTVVSLSKEDVGGKELPGASMSLLDENRNIIIQWYSSDKPYIIEGLTEGKYILHEDLSPLGFNISNDIEFLVKNTDKVQKVTMIDTFTKISKVDEDEKYIKGATLQVTSKKTKDIIDEWITGQHIFDITDEMKKGLKDNKAINGTIIKDGISTQYKITANKDSKDYMLMLVINGETSYYYIDINGDETSHLVRGLYKNNDYVLTETKTPEGYATAKPQEFTIKSNNVSLTMVDAITKVEILKQDITTSKELSGAHLKLEDITDPNSIELIQEFISTNKSTLFKGLKVGHKYRLTEMIAPDGYQIAQNIEFTVKDTAEVQKIVMYDKAIPIHVKTGDNTNILSYILLALFMIILILFNKKENFQKIK